MRRPWDRIALTSRIKRRTPLYTTRACCRCSRTARRSRCRRASPPTGIPSLPAFGFDSRWPFDGTDNLLTFTDNITWIKGPHIIKAGFYFEHEARNVSDYSVYNTAGTYYFGSDLGNPVDTGGPFSNALTGNLYGYGQDNLKPIHRTRYKQTEWS